MSRRPAHQPFVSSTPSRVDAVLRRAQADIVLGREARFWALVAEWATRDGGPFPTREQAERQVREELEVLCRALGTWAALTPDEVFPARRPEPPDDEDPWG